MLKRFLFIIASASLLAACSVEQGVPSDASQGEINMARMMGISVEELRRQTPEEHMKMMMEMHGNRTESVPSDDSGDDVGALPEARGPETMKAKDGDTIELTLTPVKKTVNGVSFKMYGYNGQIPGPLIRAPQGSTVTIHVINDIDMPTTVHWHGLRLDNANDGVPDVTQPPIRPGEDFTYSVRFPDEGVYWYHPHVREDIQQEMGLYGNMIVSPANEDAYAPVNGERALVLDDLLLEHGVIPAYRTDTTLFPLMGRFGNVFLLNGEPAPEYWTEVQKGSVIRFYFTNVANTRTFRVRIEGASMKLVGSDIGRYEHEEMTDAITLAPAERAIVDVYFKTPGRHRIMHESPLLTKELGAVVVSDTSASPSYEAQFATMTAHADVSEDIAKYKQYFDRPVDKTLRMTIKLAGGMNHGMMMHEDASGIEWEDAMPMMNAVMTDKDTRWILRDEETGRENMDILWKFQSGDVKKIRVINDKKSAHPMQHPFHIHGQRFLVLSMDGKPNENLVWKDTVLIPAGSTAELLLDASNPGNWMFHCHIAEHLQNGMMGSFIVE